MKTKKLLITFILISCTLILFSKDINRATAEKVAVNFFYESSNIFNTAVKYHNLSIMDITKVDDAYYVVNLENGWVLIAADDAMVPVLGYNYRGKFVSKDQQADNVKSFLQHFVDQINFIRENNIESDNEVTDQWNHYLNSDSVSLLAYKGNRDQVEPLLTNIWDQIYPYNILCPEDAAGSGGHVVVGCVATAMAQIMHYWRYPLQGSGSHSYYIYPYGTQTVNYGETYYDFNAMQDEIDYGNPWEIAKISYHAAVSVDMDFGPDGSGASAYDVPYALETYFNYDNSCQYVQRSSYDFAVWQNMMQEELDNLCPINYIGTRPDVGHSFVCDGYEGDNYYHFNFGWSGYQNGFYSLFDLNGFNSYQGMVYHIYPDDPDYPYIAEGETILTSVSGSFTDGSGPVEDYSTGMDASWLIDPQTETDSIVDITLTFIQFNTAASDYLRVYDGGSTSDELLGEFSGDELPVEMTSSGNKMLITFSSTGTEAGFKAEYNTTTPTYCIPTAVFTDPSGTLSDGSGTFHYNNLTTCIYIIQHEEGVNYNIEFTSFSTEENKDVVTIYDGDQNMVGEFSGSELPDVLEIETDMVFITWGTNATIKDEGWSFDYTVDGVGIKEDIIKNNLCIIPNPFTTSTTIEYKLKQPEKVSLWIYNHLGQLIYQTKENQSKGKQQLMWNGESYPNGIYFYTLQVGKQVANGKMVKTQ